MKRLITILFSLAIVIGFSFQVQADSVKDDDDVIDEKFGLPIIVYGETLTEEQRQQVRDAVNVKNKENVEESVVTAQDLVRYIGGNPNSRMYSSVKITLKEKGHGLIVKRVTPENITKVTEEMYANALLTAGVENADVEVASPVKVTGESALTGIYKAYEDRGENLDPDRMEVANDELDIATNLAEKDGLDSEKVGELLTEIKKMIAEQNPVTREEVEQIVEEQLSKMNIKLDEKDRQLLIDLFEKMRELNIDFDGVKQQLESISKDIKDKLSDVIGDEGFWDRVSEFFKKLFDSIANLFK